MPALPSSVCRVSAAPHVSTPCQVHGLFCPSASAQPQGAQARLSGSSFPFSTPVLPVPGVWFVFMGGEETGGDKIISWVLYLFLSLIFNRI